MSLSKPLPILPQMPWNIKKLIATSTDMNTNLSLRQCSKDFKSVVDEIRISVKHARIILHADHVLVSFNIPLFVEKKLSFPKTPFPGNMRNSLGSSIRKAVDYFMMFLKQKRMFVEELKIGFEPEENVTKKQKFMSCLMQSLESLDHKLKVKEVKLLLLEQENAIPTIISHLEPGTLGRISLEANSDWNYLGRPIALQSIAGTEQWKRVTSLEMFGYSTDLPEAEIERINHFRADIEHLTLERVKRIVEKALQCVEYRSTWLVCKTSEKEDIEKYWRKFHAKRIPGTDKKLFLNFNMWGFQIGRLIESEIDFPWIV